MDDKTDVWLGTLALIEPLHDYGIARYIEQTAIHARFLSSTNGPA